MKVKKTNLVWLVFFGSLVFVFALCLVNISLTLAFKNKFYPQTKISGVDIGNKTKEEAAQALQAKNDNYLNQGELEIVFLDKKKKISPKDLAVSFAAEKTINLFFKETHQNLIFSPLVSLFSNKKEDQIITIDEAKAAEIINQLAADEIILPKDASLEIVNDSIIFSEAKAGLGPEIRETKEAIKGQISSLQSGSIAVKKGVLRPQISDIDLAQAYFKTSFLLQNKGFKLKDNGKTVYQIKPQDLKDWLKFEKKSYANFKESDAFKGRVAGVSISAKDKLGVFVLPQILRTEEALEANIDETKINNFIKLLAAKVDQKPEEAKLAVNNNAIEVVKKESLGYELDQNKLLEEINMRLNSSSETDIELPTKVLVPEIRSDNISELGLKEKIAVGESQFAGSPKNRINNLTLGASKFNGAVIRPDEVASFAKIVGSVEPQDGYLPELVIKGTQTIQEYGGGMCQVSTTFYRTALNAGLPIIERHPHAYLVGYYKDGPDATVYVPSTDLKFKNDTGHYILIQTKVDLTKKKMTFELWGTNDGRKVAVNAPVFSDPVPAPIEPYYVDDPAYPTGYLAEEEHAHEGVTGIIIRTITYPDGKTKTNTIKSTYKPWPAKIRRGIGPADLPIPPKE